MLLFPSQSFNLLILFAEHLMVIILLKLRLMVLDWRGLILYDWLAVSLCSKSIGWSCTNWDTVTVMSISWLSCWHVVSTTTTTTTIGRGSRGSASNYRSLVELGASLREICLLPWILIWWRRSECLMQHHVMIVRVSRILKWSSHMLIIVRVIDVNLILIVLMYRRGDLNTMVMCHWFRVEVVWYSTIASLKGIVVLKATFQKALLVRLYTLFNDYSLSILCTLWIRSLLLVMIHYLSRAFRPTTSSCKNEGILFGVLNKSLWARDALLILLMKLIRLRVGRL